MTSDECKVDGCDRGVRTLGWCAAHYNQWYTTGVEPSRPFTDKARFEQYFDRRESDECWPWKAGRSSTGYGKFSVNGRATPAHRVSYTLYKGSIPDGLLIRHTCDNKPCVNPNHLLTGTSLDNSRDAVERNLIPRGEAQGRAKLTLRQVEEIRAILRGPHESNRAIGARFGVSKATIQRISAGRMWIGLGENA